MELANTILHENFGYKCVIVIVNDATPACEELSMI